MAVVAVVRAAVVVTSLCIVSKFEVARVVGLWDVVRFDTSFQRPLYTCGDRILLA